jgi:2-polyprenyl-3-methyl-5-hydroxy-6-metoxy-1,4-benzoquinol methylase
MKSINDISGYRYHDAELNPSHQYLIPKVVQLLSKVNVGQDRRVFELGCGNGAIAAHLSNLGYTVTGIDASEESIRNANKQYPDLELYQGSAYEALAERYGAFPALISLEVVEHLYAPRKYASVAFDLLQPGGTAIISTPYHGYWKNLALAVTGKMDSHFTALWDNGHIKFWSFKTLGILLSEAGFVDIQFHRVGRIAPLAKSMIATARKPR